MATGRVAQGNSNGDASLKPVAAGDVNGDGATEVRESPSKSPLRLRESPTKASTGKRESPTKQSTGVADVDGDGTADKTASQPNSAATINTSHSNIKSPRDVATGQASGKRQH